MKGNLLEVYNLFLKHKTLTDHELERLSVLNPNSIRPSRLKLEEMGIIARTNLKKKATKGRGDERGKYVVYELVKEVDPNKIAKRKSSKISRNAILTKLRSLKQKIKQLQKSVNKIVNTI